MATTTRAAERRRKLDLIAEALDADIAATGERVQSARRSLERHQTRYAQLIEARTALRELEQ